MLSICFDPWEVLATVGKSFFTHGGHAQAPLSDLSGQKPSRRARLAAAPWGLLRRPRRGSAFLGNRSPRRRTAAARDRGEPRQPERLGVLGIHEGVAIRNVQTVASHGGRVC